ncbi:MAG: SRPBCC family protein [Cyanobacteriota bacterium]|nr:SRPBCC family protein [Cyanobacteriota bacterium]
MGRWLDHTVTTEIAAPVERVWAVWSDLEAMPRWMRWIESVVTVADDPDLTDWTLAAQGFRFHWKARITQRVEAQQLHWQSVGGLPTRGAVRFYPQGPQSTAVKLSVSYELPGALAPLMEPTMLGGIVTKELQANLDRFRDLVESETAASGDSAASADSAVAADAAGGLPEQP